MGEGAGVGGGNLLFSLSPPLTLVLSVEGVGLFESILSICKHSLYSLAINSMLSQVLQFTPKPFVHGFANVMQICLSHISQVKLERSPALGRRGPGGAPSSTPAQIRASLSVSPASPFPRSCLPPYSLPSHLEGGLFPSLSIFKRSSYLCLLTLCCL